MRKRSKEEVIQTLRNIRQGCMGYPPFLDALDMAIEALSADALLKQEIDFHKEVSRIEAEKVVDLEHKLADMVSVVRCKDCRWWNGVPETMHNNHLCHNWSKFGSINTSADDFCSCGERREE